MGSLRPNAERQYRDDVRHGMSGKECLVSNDFQWFLGIDWGSEKHRLCLMDRGGKVLEQKWVEHNGSGLADLVDWLQRITNELAVYKRQHPNAKVAPFAGVEKNIKPRTFSRCAVL